MLTNAEICFRNSKFVVCSIRATVEVCLQIIKTLSCEGAWPHRVNVHYKDNYRNDVYIRHCEMAH